MEQKADFQRDRESIQDFDVFLCHHGQDQPVIKQIGEQLKLRGIKPWLDEWELRPGLPWQQLLEQQIEQIKAVAVFVGKSGIGPWQQQELNAFLREFVSRGCPVIPVLLADAPQKPELSVFLKAMTWVDFRFQDPLASNGGPTQTLALLKGSPAIDVMPLTSALCPKTDQRGHKRPDNPKESACDIGAYES